MNRDDRYAQFAAENRTAPARKRPDDGAGNAAPSRLRLGTDWSRIGVNSLLLFAAVVLFAGCRSIPLPKPPVEDVAVERKQRKAVAVEQFERNRNFAEFHAARAARDRGDLRNSQAGLESLLRRDPQHREARMLLATVLFEQGRSADALAQLQTAVNDFPNDPETHRAMGDLLTKLNQPADACAHLDRASRLAAQSDPSLAGDPKLAQGATGVAPVPPPRQEPSGTRQNENGMVIPASGMEATGKAGSPVSSRGAVTPLAHDSGAPNTSGFGATLSPGVSALLQQGGQALTQHDPERALAAFRQAAALEPGNPHIPTAAAIAALNQGSPQVAVVVAQEALRTFPRWTPLLRTLGAAYYRQGDYESSQLVLQQALSLDKSDALAYFLLGCTHTKLGQSDAATTCFTEARRIDPSLLPAESPMGAHDSLR